MYEENNSTFALKSIIIKILVAILLVFIIIWLFPTKGYIDKAIDKKLGTNAEQIFNTNIGVMKNAATGYFNGSRLPQAEGNTKTITLKEMLEEDLLVEFTDSQGKKCDVEKSYVTVKKNKDEYKMTTNLVCTDKQAKVVSYFGEYDYCTDGLCEKKKLTENAEKTETEKVNTTNENKDQAVASTCEYMKKGGYYSYGNWSNWSKTKVTQNNSREVQTKTERVKTGTQTVKVGTTTVKGNPTKLTYSNGAIVYVCPEGYDNAGRYSKPRYCTKTVDKYETKDVYSNVTYYRYRSRKYVSNNSYKWDSCNSNLTKQGYVKTGKTK